MITSVTHLVVANTIDRSQATGASLRHMHLSAGTIGLVAGLLALISLQQGNELIMGMPVRPIMQGATALLALVILRLDLSLRHTWTLHASGRSSRDRALRAAGRADSSDERRMAQIIIICDAFYALGLLISGLHSVWNQIHSG